MAELTLVTGGARSGKSIFGQETALKSSGKRVFIATAQPFDDEMATRISNHKRERGDDFITIEAPIDLVTALRSVPDDASVVLIDCLTVWVGNLMYRFEDDVGAIGGHISSFVNYLDTLEHECIIVTNEVGMGIVPENALARQFRDIAGNLNRQVASRADTVYLCVCGIPVAVKAAGR